MSKLAALMYAELLLNIRQVTIIAALQTPCDPTTKAELTTHGQQITLQHDGDTTTLTLPGQVAPHTRLQKPAIGSKEVSWRLPLVDTPMRVVVENTQSNEAPWSARSLEEDAEFKCRECGAMIIENGTIKTWKDLPSENWAEMMEFWHCHKPADHVEEGVKGHADHNVVAATKDYGANTRFAAQSEVGFVNLTTFLLANTDCSNVETEASKDDQKSYQKLSCRSCHCYIGYVDYQAKGNRLYKWRLSLPPQTQQRWAMSAPFSTQPSMPLVLSAQLIALMQSQCSSRLLLFPMGWKPPSTTSSSNLPSNQQQSTSHLDPPSSFATSATSLPSLDCSSEQWNNLVTPESSPLSSQPRFLNIWCLSPSLRFCSTNHEEYNLPISPQSNKSSPGTLAMKVFWKTVSIAEATVLMDREGVEEVELPVEAIVEMENCLRDSAQLLPPNMRKFKEWDVGLVDRFEE